METASYILLAMGILGGVDILLFHSIAHGIRSHPDSKNELFAHSLRGPIYGTLFILIPNFELGGSYVWLLFAILVLDVAVSIWDFSVEAASRKIIGGLPTGEYILHIFMAML